MLERIARLAVLCASLIWSASAQAGVFLQYETSFGFPREDLREPLPVAVSAGPDGSICVVDATTRSGSLFDAHDVHLFTTSGVAGLGDPLDMIVDQTGGFVCTDSRPEGGRTIRRLDFFGQPLAYEPERPADSWQPEHLLLTRDGNYVTTDASTGLLAKNDAATGALIWKQPLQEYRSGDLIGLGRPAEAPDGRLFLPIPGNHQIVVLSSEGEPEATFGTPGAAQGRLSFPVGIAFCPDGTIAVLDRMRHVVLLYDERFQFLSEFGRFGTGPTDLYYPTAITATADGRIYVAQGLGGRIHRFRFAATGSMVLNSSRSRLADAGRVERSNRSRREGGA